MKFSESWLREWINPNISTQHLCEQLTMAGLEVDQVGPVSERLDKVVVGIVEDIKPHINADRLQVCQVNIGTETSLQIVCGASNVKKGMHVPTALVGATLPKNIKIKSAKLRGVASSGMLCSGAELGLAENTDGLWALPTDSRAGDSIRHYLNLDDHCIEVDLTPNRGDCLSICGIARDLAAVNDLPINIVQYNKPVTSHDNELLIKIDEPAACPKYCGRIIENIDYSATTPLWMQEKLRRSDIRPISLLVDITNYVLLELGQPMHAFDYHKIESHIEVRYAHKNETIKLLNGKTIHCTTDTLVIADKNKVIALAGIMGGESTAIDGNSQTVFLESAHFNPLNMAGKARQYDAGSDSSYRFERGVDYNLPKIAIERASALILEIAGGEMGPISEISNSDYLPKPHKIAVRPKQINRLLGTEISAKKIRNILERLGMPPEQTGEHWHIFSPSYRFDIKIEADLIEEIARIYGYNNINSVQPLSTLEINAHPETNISIDSLMSIMVNRSYYETINYSFIDSHYDQTMDPLHKAITLLNPIAKEMAVMRTTLWSGLIKTFNYNLNRQQKRIRLFEVGQCFVQHDSALRQTNKISALAFGSAAPEQWGIAHETVDFFQVKSDLEALLDASQSKNYYFQSTEHPALHPGQTAEIIKDNERIGIIGKIHPEIASQLNINDNFFLFELDILPLTKSILPQYQKLSKYPSLRRDIALMVDKETLVDSVLQCIQRCNIKYLTDISLFDQYQTDLADKKSLAFALTWQDNESTLDDQTIEKYIKQILKQLHIELNATLRG